MELGQEYLDKANECTSNATAAKSEPEQLSWLKLAEGYLRLMRWRQRPADTFGRALSAQGTGQQDSTASH